MITQFQGKKMTICEWQQVESAEADFDKHYFIKVTNQWIFEPQLISKLVLRGEVGSKEIVESDSVRYYRTLIPRSKRDFPLEEIIQIIQTENGNFE
jgi:hypothetical protein